MSRSLDLRERAVAAVESGMKRAQVCQVFGIHRNTLGRWHKRARSGTLAPVPPAGAARKMEPQDQALLLSQLQARPDATVDEHLRLWQEAGHKSVSRATLGRAILRLGWTRKKRA